MMSVVTHLLAVGIGVLFAGAYLLPSIRRAYERGHTHGMRDRVIRHEAREAIFSREQDFRQAEGA